MEEEKYIEERIGKRNPFLVPDGYFDQFADQMMASLPERKPRAKSIWLRPAIYVAAGICALFGLVAALKFTPISDQTVPVQAQVLVQEQADDSFDEAADYMMLDNHDIYAYMADY